MIEQVRGPGERVQGPTERTQTHSLTHPHIHTQLTNRPARNGPVVRPPRRRVGQGDSRPRRPPSGAGGRPCLQASGGGGCVCALPSFFFSLSLMLVCSFFLSLCSLFLSLIHHPTLCFLLNLVFLVVVAEAARQGEADHHSFVIFFGSWHDWNIPELQAGLVGGCVQRGPHGGVHAGNHPVIIVVYL
jgi:hypothetical protein